MKRSDDFAQYTQSGLPAVLVSSDGHVLSRSNAALSLSRKFRCNSNLQPFFPPDFKETFAYCAEKSEVATIALSLPEGSCLSALLVPTRYEDGDCFLLLLFKEELLADLPFCLSSAVRAAFAKESPKSEDAEFAAEFFTRALRKSYAFALTEEDFPNVFSVKHACAFLNRFSKERLLEQGMDINALCTSDCADLPLYNFPRFTALITCLCLFCLSVCREAEIRALFFTEAERIALRLSFLPKEELSPNVALPLSLFETPLRLVCYDIFEEQDEKGVRSLTLICQKTVPAGAIRTDEDEKLAELLLSVLLARVTEE